MFLNTGGGSIRSFVHTINHQYSYRALDLGMCLLDRLIVNGRLPCPGDADFEDKLAKLKLAILAATISELFKGFETNP